MNMIAKFLLLVALSIFPVLASAEETLPESIIEIVTQKSASHFLTVEVAENKEQQSKGLMFRTDLAEDRGMLFLFKDNPYAAMWMKNTLISLDMLFIDKQGKIIYIAQKTQPESLDVISAYAPTAAVLEVKAGIAEKLGITEGDMVKHYYFEQ